MKTDLVVVVPSRGRPGNIADLVEAWAATSTGTAALVVAVDDDDPELPGYQGLGLAAREPDITLLVQPAPGSMVAALNLAARDLAQRHFAVGFFGDDHLPRTVGFDAELVEALHQVGTGIVTGSDGLRADQLPTWCAMTSDIIRCLGYMSPPGLQHMYVDNSWQTLGEAIGGFRYLPDVLVEHMHPVAGKAAMDEGYWRVNDASVYARDQAQFTRWVREDLPEAVRRLSRVREAAG